VCPTCRDVQLSEERRTVALERQAKAAAKQTSLFRTEKARRA
jgi:hypothetical protein